MMTQLKLLKKYFLMNNYTFMNKILGKLKKKYDDFVHKDYRGSLVKVQCSHETYMRFFEGKDTLTINNEFVPIDKIKSIKNIEEGKIRIIRDIQLSRWNSFKLHL